VFLIIGEKSRAAAQANVNLCATCSYYSRRRFSQNNREIHMCSENYQSPFALSGPVSACSSYYDKNKPQLHDLDKIAWTIETSKKTVGFIPPSKRTDIGKEFVVQGEPLR